MSKTKALSERCEQQCFAKGFVELRTVVRSFSETVGSEHMFVAEGDCYVVEGPGGQVGRVKRQTTL